jgi:hypothetical protein
MPHKPFAVPSRCGFAAAVLVLAQLATAAGQQAVTIGRDTYVNHGLVAVGRIPASLRDQYGETFGSGSGLAVDAASWSRSADGLAGTIFLLPDRGYNLGGTTAYQPRINRLAARIRIGDDPSAIAPGERQRTLETTLADTIRLTDAGGEPLTSLDPTDVRAAAGGFPPLPQAANGRVSLDAEALVRLADGTFFMADEYGPYIYRFSAEGRMLSAIRPPDAFIPRRDGRDSFSSNNPPAGGERPVPLQPQTGRWNNQGFEGLALTPDGRHLAAILQSATRQDSGATWDERAMARMVVYDIADPEKPVLVREHVVPLPIYAGADGKEHVAAQSEFLALDATRFLLLCRDGDAGFALKSAMSRFRRAMLVDVTEATNIADSAYDGLTPVAPNGVLAAGVVPARLSPLVDINDQAMLSRFGLRNGEPNDRDNLSEKWESMGLVPLRDAANPRDVLLIVANDNDFITQDGFQAGKPFRDPSGADVDTMFLIYRLTLPAAP